MPDPKESYLNLEEDDGVERIDEQVQKAQEQLLHLRRQQELIEKQKRELEELSRKQELLQQGRSEMIEHFTRALVVLERETYDAQKRVEQLRAINESFVQHLANLETINPKSWEGADMNRELSKALSAVDDARGEYIRSRAVINADSNEEMLAPTGSEGSDAAGHRGHGFVYWFKSGLAFTLPLIVTGIAMAVAVFMFLRK